MTEKHPYLRDEELLALMRQLERDIPAAAPGDLEERVLAQIRESRRRAALAPQRRKLSPSRELWRYRFQVITAVTAAILLLFLAPASSAPVPMSSPPAETVGWIETLQRRWWDSGGLLNKLWEYNGGFYEKPE